MIFYGGLEGNWEMQEMKLGEVPKKTESVRKGNCFGNGQHQRKFLGFKQQ